MLVKKHYPEELKGATHLPRLPKPLLGLSSQHQMPTKPEPHTVPPGRHCPVQLQLHMLQAKMEPQLTVLKPPQT